MTRSTALVTAYVLALVAANLVITELGPAAVIPVGLVLIGATLTIRDRLHDHLGHGLTLVVGMGMLLACGAFLSYLLNRDAGPVAIASVVAFTLATVVDAVLYAALEGRRPWVRSVASSAPAGLVDSAAFLIVLTGGIPVVLILAQALAKAIGSALWAAVLYRDRPTYDHHEEELEEDRAARLRA